MRIAFSGTANTGKTTLINKFSENWKNYKTPARTYRDLIREKQLPHSSQATPDTQLEILKFMVSQCEEYTKESKIVYDRCPLDNLAYTLWCHDKQIEGFDKPFVDLAISITKESMRHLDIIFILKYDTIIKVEDDGLRDANIEYIKEVDNIFEALYQQYTQNLHADVFFPKDDSPCLIKLPTSIQERIAVIADYIDPDGELYGDEESIFNPNNLNQLEQLVQQQKNALEAEQRERELYNKFKI